MFKKKKNLKINLKVYKKRKTQLNNCKKSYKTK